MLNNTSVKYEQPNDINIILKNHQLAMLYKCMEIEKKSNICIMRDKPGAGKTYVILSFINELKKRNKLLKNGKNETNETNIIIVPQNIYFQWIISIESFSENLNYGKYVEYDNILNLYNNTTDLYGKDVILTISSYYYVIASTLKSLNLKVNRVFIDEIDSISTFINMEINADFMMFISASFNVENNGFFTDKIKDTNIDDITCVCAKEFIDENIILEPPIKYKYLCSNILVDNVLSHVVSQEELKNINAMEYKLNNKTYERCVARDEKELIDIILKENKIIINSCKLKIDDIQKNIKNYEEVKEKKVIYLKEFQENYNKLYLVSYFKKTILKVINEFQYVFSFYLEFTLDSSLSDLYDILLEKRRVILKNLRNNLNDIIELLYNFNNKKNKSNNESETNNFNIMQLNNVFDKLLNIIYMSHENIEKIKKEFDANKELSNSFLTTFFEDYKKFENYVSLFNKNIINLKSSFECDEQLVINKKNLKENEDKIAENENKNNQIIDRIKNNNICPVCYCLLEDKSITKVYVSSDCCNNKICNVCVEEWFQNKKKERCIFCNLEEITIDKYSVMIKEEINQETEKNIVQNKDENNNNNNMITTEKYNNTKLSFIKEFIDSNKDKDMKVIIFSDYSNIFTKIESYCNEIKIGISELDKGNMREIEKAVIDYKIGNSKIMLANSSLFGCGMNLENSSHIIFVHKMNSAMEMQVIGRAQRLGRKGVLNIINLEYENENVIELENKNIHFEPIIIKNELDDLQETLLNNLNNNNTNEIINEVIDEVKDKKVELYIPDRYINHVDVNLEELISNLS